MLNPSLAKEDMELNWINEISGTGVYAIRVKGTKNILAFAKLEPYPRDRLGRSGLIFEYFAIQIEKDSDSGDIIVRNPTRGFLCEDPLAEELEFAFVAHASDMGIEMDRIQVTSLGDFNAQSKPRKRNKAS